MHILERHTVVDNIPFWNSIARLFDFASISDQYDHHHPRDLQVRDSGVGSPFSLTGLGETDLIADQEVDSTHLDKSCSPFLVTQHLSFGLAFNFLLVEHKPDIYKQSTPNCGVGSQHTLTGLGVTPAADRYPEDVNFIQTGVGSPFTFSGLFLVLGLLIATGHGEVCLTSSKQHLRFQAGVGSPFSLTGPVVTLIFRLFSTSQGFGTPADCPHSSGTDVFLQLISGGGLPFFTSHWPSFLLIWIILYTIVTRQHIFLVILQFIGVGSLSCWLCWPLSGVSHSSS